MIKRSVLAAAISASMLLPTSGAQAANANSSFLVQATLTNFCTVSAANVAFGSISAGVAAANTSSKITLTCNKGATVTSVGLDNGQHATGTQKAMKNGANADVLNYKIDVPTGAAFNGCPAAGAGPEWNATNTIVATPLFAVTGGAKLINLCASIPVGQFPSAGAYQDSVNVNVVYN
jgi:spore coat protein U-like protein